MPTAELWTLPRLVPDALVLAAGAGLLVWLVACWLSGRE